LKDYENTLTSSQLDLDLLNYPRSQHSRLIFHVADLCSTSIPITEARFQSLPAHKRYTITGVGGILRFAFYAPCSINFLSKISHHARITQKSCKPDLAFLLQCSQPDTYISSRAISSLIIIYIRSYIERLSIMKLLQGIFCHCLHHTSFLPS
jgi:hypothetical protein